MSKTIVIQKQILATLKELIIEHNQYEKPKLKLDLAVFYTSLLNSLPSFYRGVYNQNLIVSLDSQILKKYNSKYNKYIEFLLRNEIIELIKNYGVDTKSSKQYILCLKYQGGEVTTYKIKDKCLLKKFNSNGIEKFEKQIQRIQYCKDTRPFLVKWFNENLSINHKEANNIIAPYLESNYSKYTCAKQLILEFHNQQWQYSIKRESDNRLHTNLTRLNRVLRPTIRYNNKTLGAIDISCSQPYFFSVVLKAILKKDINLLKRIGATKVLSSISINELFNLDIDRNEVIRFVKSVIDESKDFYTEFSKHLTVEYDDRKRIFRRVSNFGTKQKRKQFDTPSRIEYYDSKRDLAKNVIMEIFFSKPKTTIKEAKQFRKIYPSVSIIMNHIKNNCVEFHRLLTVIESHCLLDCVAKEFSKKHKNIPLFSIHDSLVTTKDCVDLLENEIKNMLLKITTLQLRVKRDLFI